MGTVYEGGKWKNLKIAEHHNPFRRVRSVSYFREEAHLLPIEAVHGILTRWTVHTK